MLTEYNYEGNAMGTEYAIAIISKDEGLAHKVAHNVQEKIHTYESRFSRFLPESELSILNTKKHAVISSEFFEVLSEAHALFTRTQGIFNPLLQVERLGYTKNFDDIKEIHETELNELYDIDFSTTLFSEATHTVKLQNGQKLDFGGFLKGYLATKLCREITEVSSDISGAIVNIGGDLHTHGTDADGNPFSFSLYNPVTNKDDIFITFQNKSLATSGTYKRTWKYQQKRVNHILDRTGESNPTTDILSASVCAPQGGTAEAYAKVFLSAGPYQALKILPKKEPIEYLIIRTNGVIESNML